MVFLLTALPRVINVLHTSLQTQVNGGCKIIIMAKRESAVGLLGNQKGVR